MAKRVKQSTTPNLNQAVTASLLGQAIRAKRTQSNLRLEDAAALCGVAKQTLMQIEKGRATSQLDSVLQICSGLGLSLYIKPWQSEVEDEWQ